MAVRPATHGGDVAGRKVVYGANAVLQGALVLAAVIFAVFVAQRYQGQLDLSVNRVNSLSSRTVNLLKKLDQDVRVTAIYVDLARDKGLAVKRSKTVGDLLDLYRNANPARVATELINPEKDLARVQAILTRLKEKSAYKDEAKPHEKALTEFPAINEKITKLCKEELDRFQQLVQSDGKLSRLRELGIIANNLSVTEREAAKVAEDIADLSKGDIKRYGQAVEEMRKFLTSSRGAFSDAVTWMTTKGLDTADIAPDSKSFFGEAGGRLGAIIPEIDRILSETNDLKQVKLEQVYEELSRWSSSPPVLVENATEARVASFDDVWVARDMGGMPPGPDNDPYQFNGETAISSLILQLTQKDKTAVVFARWGGESPLRPDFSKLNINNIDLNNMPRAPYGMLNEVLQKQNFVTHDWDLADEKQKQLPEIADARRKIFVVLPPAPPPQPNPMQRMQLPGISPQDKELVLSAVKSSGMAIFLAGWKMPDRQAQVLGQSGGYDYNEYLKQNWGIDVQSEYLAMWFQPSPEKADLYWPKLPRSPTVITTDIMRFTEHPIVKPLQTSSAAFRETAPLRLLSGDALPKNVTLEPLVTVEKTVDAWAVRDATKLSEDFRARNGTFRREDDMSTPFPVSVAATNGETGARIVVFGSDNFAEDSLSQQQAIGFAGGGFMAYVLYPANTDLFINALHWVTNEADRIAVGPRTSSVPRLDQLKEGAQANFVRVFVAVIWPALALVIGSGVWLLRRR